MPSTLRFSVFFLLVWTTVTEQVHLCLDHCGPEQGNFGVCLGNSWLCGQDEYCHLTIIKDGFRHDCRHAGEMRRCEPQQHANAESCDPRLTHTPEHHECHFCCQDMQCFTNLTTGPAPTEVPPVHPHHTCYTSQCRHGHDDLAACTAGHWACGQDEFCDIRLSHDGLHMDCKHNGPDRAEYQHCMEAVPLNPEGCDPTAVKATTPDCHYCCEGEQCVNQLLAASPPSSALPETSQHHAITSESTFSMSEVLTSPAYNAALNASPASTSSVVMTQVPAAGANSCYTTPCHHGDDITACISGQWACADDEICQLKTSNGTRQISMACLPSTVQTAEECVIALEQRPCSTAEDFEQKECLVCCPEAACVSHAVLRFSAKALLSSQDLATSQQPPFTWSNTTVCQDIYPEYSCAEVIQHCDDDIIQHFCPKTCHTCDACADVYKGNCSEDFAGRCAERTVQMVCGKTCKTCDCPNKVPDCAEQYADQCSNPVVRLICPRTCRSCHETPETTMPLSRTETTMLATSTTTTTMQATTGTTTTTARSTTLPTTTTTILASTTTTTPTTTPTTAPTTPTTVTTTTPTTVATTTSTIVTQTTSAAVTTTTPTTAAITTPPHRVAGRCAVCSGLDCLLHEPRNKVCPPGSDYCLTTVSDSSHGREIDRSCATKDFCDAIVPNFKCVNIESQILGAGETCSYCCDLANCNEPPYIIPHNGHLDKHSRA